MNATHQAISAYGRANTPLRTDRGIEFEIFAKVTHQIKDASQMGPASFPALAAALHTNRKLWTTLAADVSNVDNHLPSGLKSQIFYLSKFVADHTRKVLKGAATSDALTDINLSVMRGLGCDGGAP